MIKSKTVQVFEADKILNPDLLKKHRLGRNGNRPILRLLYIGQMAKRPHMRTSIKVEKNQLRTGCG